jgi:hypothetical protein
MKDIRTEFLVNREETGREIVRFIETGKEYYIEYIEPRNFKTEWGDVDPATKKTTGSYGSKNKGAIKDSESLITKENGFNEIIYGSGSPYHTIVEMHNKWKLENGVL